MNMDTSCPKIHGTVVVLDLLHWPEWRVFLLRWEWCGNGGSAADNWTEIRRGLITLSDMCSVRVFSQLLAPMGLRLCSDRCIHVACCYCAVNRQYKAKLYSFYHQQYPLRNALPSICWHTQLHTAVRVHKSTFSSKYDHMSNMFS